ncbi:MerR family DNA-binding transcriptional regulator, partial [Halomonas sp.]|uniref:MerR family DNA-binding transcriptional regulator n=1 Tax=Halomonas sp. TaxID=1486246 RepID=UPI0030811D63
MVESINPVATIGSRCRLKSYGRNISMSDHNAAIGIGELARRADCKPETVRYYERVGLVDEA